MGIYAESVEMIAMKDMQFPLVHNSNLHALIPTSSFFFVLEKNSVYLIQLNNTQTYTTRP